VMQHTCSCNVVTVGFSSNAVSYRNYMNDSFRTNAFVRFRPETIACACIYLAARNLQVLFVMSNFKLESLIFVCMVSFAFVT